MLDTRGVRGAIFTVVAGVFFAGAGCCQTPNAPGWASAVEQAARLDAAARIAVVQISGGQLLAASHLPQTARTLAAPGSTLKPLVLYGLIAAGRWDPARRIACDRKLRIAGRPLACSHPEADPMNARLALTWSCNTYFAAVGGTLGAGDLRKLLAPTGLLAQTGLAPGEAVAELRDPQSADANRLAVLGLEGIAVSPLELAIAYRWLALQIGAHPEAAASQVVFAGLKDSASFGMAGAASLGGVPVAGKTGTASPMQGEKSHGWFVGMAPAGNPTVVIAVYVPVGHGADAARVAGALLGNSPLRQRKP
jgi:cell division protein FtsI/penicillin-binding protein 2